MAVFGPGLWTATMAYSFRRPIPTGWLACSHTVNFRLATVCWCCSWPSSRPCSYWPSGPAAVHDRF